MAADELAKEQKSQDWTYQSLVDTVLEGSVKKEKTERQASFGIM